MVPEHPNPTHEQNAVRQPGIPGSGGPAHPRAAIPLPSHGFETLDLPERELASIPGHEVVARAAVGLLSAASDKLGLSPGEEPDIDIAGARVLITALAGLLRAAQDSLGDEWPPLLAGLRTLQSAYREAAARPEAPGEGPGEQYLT